jgi:hypothetical protein
MTKNRKLKIPLKVPLKQGFKNVFKKFVFNSPVLAWIRIRNELKCWIWNEVKPNLRQRWNGTIFPA